MEKLFGAVYESVHMNEIREYIHQLDKDEVTQTDERGFDLIHHAIFANNAEVASLVSMLSQRSGSAGYPVAGPHLHLACALGNSRILHILLQNNMDAQVKLCVPKVQIMEYIGLWKEHFQNSNNDACTTQQLGNLSLKAFHSEKSELSCIDLAAMIGSLRCVEVILGQNCIQWNSVSNVERSTELNSPEALQLLLEKDRPDIEVINEAFKSALRRKLHLCLGILIEAGASTMSVLNNLNPFHVMFMYSSAYQVHGQMYRNIGLSECTSILVSNGFNVSVKDPVGTYPLYSILYSLVREKDHNPAGIPEHHIKTMDILLEAGSDPNYDEVMHSKQTEGVVAVGREQFTSGLNAFLVSLQSSDSWRAHMAPYIDYCCAQLLKHGAAPDYVDSYGETPLHDLMKLWAMQHAMGHMHTDLSNMCQMLLKNGANPSLQSTNGLYPVHYYFTILCNLMGGRFAFQRWVSFPSSTRVLQLLYFMDFESVRQTFTGIMGCCDEAKADGMPTDVIKCIENRMRDVITATKPLQVLCQLKVWECVGRSQNNLEKLYMPKQFMYDIVDMLRICI